MARLHYAEKSRADLAFIWDFIAADSPQNAAEVLDRLHDKIEQLRAQPFAGHRRGDLGRGLRCLNSDGYMIFYTASEAIVRVHRIVHHSRNLSAIQFDPES